jgi:CheY-like chemotaxis protein
MKTHWQILVVDDEEVMCESLAAWLREDGYVVDTASSGRDAVEKARLRDYAIYFVDLKMPGGMDGIETMMQIRRLHPDASIIIITAYATVERRSRRCRRARRSIMKPAIQGNLATGQPHYQGQKPARTPFCAKFNRQYLVHVSGHKNRVQEIMTPAAKRQSAARS